MKKLTLYLVLLLLASFVSGQTPDEKVIDLYLLQQPQAEKISPQYLEYLEKYFISIRDGKNVENANVISYTSFFFKLKNNEEEERIYQESDYDYDHMFRVIYIKFIDYKGKFIEIQIENEKQRKGEKYKKEKMLIHMRTGLILYYKERKGIFQKFFPITGNHFFINKKGERKSGKMYIEKESEKKIYEIIKIITGLDV